MCEFSVGKNLSKVRALGVRPSESTGSPFKMCARKTHAHKKLDGSEAGSILSVTVAINSR